MITEKQALAVSTFKIRAHGFINDGYRCVFHVEDNGLFFAKFLHRNGNRITLKLDTHDGLLSQITNGKEVFSAKMC